MENKYDLSWEEIVFEIQNIEEFKDFVYHSYLTMDISDNCERFYNSPEFTEVIRIIYENLNIPVKKDGTDKPIKILDLGASNGIASYAFARSGFEVYSLESNISRVVGKGAIEYIKNKYGLNISVKNFDGYKIKFEDNFFDIVYERQYLHHSFDMDMILSEIKRVLKPDGILLATREHIVDNYGWALKKFYRTHPIHKIYGHERAYKYSLYADSINKSGLILLNTIKPYESDINVPLGSFDKLKEDFLNSRTGKFLNIFLNKDIVTGIKLLLLKSKNRQGRLFSFIAKK